MSTKRRLTIEEFLEEIQLQLWEYGCGGFIIHECLISGEYVFQVEDLHIGVEDGMVLFYDSNYLLLNSGFSTILENNIISIYHSRINGRLHEDIRLKYGYIYIDSIAA